MARLKRVDASDPGIGRRRRGRGFEYLDENGRRVDDPEVVGRIRSLAIPPAWTDVWVCPNPRGHIQATGTDVAGRKQYRYHDDWRTRRDQEKFDAMIDFAHALPAMRRRTARHIRREQMDRLRVLACAVRMLELGFFRIGSEQYAAERDSVGLVTILKRHVTVDGDVVHFDYPSKSGKRRLQSIRNRDVGEVVARLKSRRQGSELLAHKERGRWVDVRSEDVNDYIKEVTGGDFTAKAFRTWNATVLAAVALAVSGPDATASKTARERAIRRAVAEVARYLGNTPAVSRASYIDPRVLDCFRCGQTVAGVLPVLGEDGDLGMFHGPVEEAVLDLIVGGESEAIEQAGAFAA
jgi:DNA topoisomerase IB